MISMLTINYVRHTAIDQLRAAGQQTPELDATVLLAYVLGTDRAWIYAHSDAPLTAEQAARYQELIARRAQGEPIAYLTGQREFMGLPFTVSPAVLIPRPETELLVEEALIQARMRLEQGTEPVVADIGTGSGAIAIALAVHEPRLPLIYATDISAEALSVAACNAYDLGVTDRVRFLQGHLLAPLPEPVDLLLANLPYISVNEAQVLAPDVRNYEPSVALFGPDDGLGLIRQLLKEAPPYLRAGAVILLEFGYNQRTALEAFARQCFPYATIRVIADYAGWDRLIEITLPEAIHTAWRISGSP
jgi:release factor glutamine methyltransferase